MCCAKTFAIEAPVKWKLDQRFHKFIHEVRSQEWEWPHNKFTHSTRWPHQKMSHKHFMDYSLPGHLTQSCCLRKWFSKQKLQNNLCRFWSPTCSTHSVWGFICSWLGVPMRSAYESQMWYLTKTWVANKLSSSSQVDLVVPLENINSSRAAKAIFSGCLGGQKCYSSNSNQLLFLYFSFDAAWRLAYGQTIQVHSWVWPSNWRKML